MTQDDMTPQDKVRAAFEAWREKYCLIRNPEYSAFVEAACRHAWAGAINHDRRERRTAAEEVCAEAYQVVGNLLYDLGVFETDRAKKVLDNLSEARRVHEDVLPWPSFDRQQRGEPVAHRLLRKAGSGEWVCDGGWKDGAPIPRLVKDCESEPEAWRLEYAYAAPQPAEPVVTDVQVKGPSDDDIEQMAYKHFDLATADARFQKAGHGTPPPYQSGLHFRRVKGLVSDVLSRYGAQSVAAQPNVPDHL